MSNEDLVKRLLNPVNEDRCLVRLRTEVAAALAAADARIAELEERIRAETAKNSGEVAAATDGKQVVTMAAEGAWQAAMVNEEALDKAAREGYAVRCKTHGPRTLAKYASDDIMKRQLDDARVIIEAYLSASHHRKEDS